MCNAAEAMFCGAYRPLTEKESFGALEDYAANPSPCRVQVRSSQVMSGGYYNYCCYCRPLSTPPAYLTPLLPRQPSGKKPKNWPQKWRVGHIKRLTGVLPTADPPAHHRIPQNVWKRSLVCFFFRCVLASCFRSRATMYA